MGIPMCFNSRVSKKLVGAALAFASVCSSASADISVRRASNGAITAISNLSPARDCIPKKLSGRINSLTFEHGVVRGFTLSRKEGEQYINVPAMYDFPDPRQKAVAREGYSALIQDGRNVVLKALFCGAAGRIVKMDAISTR